MGRQKNGNCIVKIDPKGNELAEYRRISEIVQETGLKYNEIRDVIKSEGTIGGCKYVYMIKKRNKKDFSFEFPWEGENGLFDIDGWAQVCF